MTNSERAKKWRLKNMEHKNEYKRLYRKKNPWDYRRDKDRERRRVGYLARVRWYSVAKKVSINDKVCQICGETKVEFHHFNYNLPYCGYFLCRKHHVAAHRDKKILENINFFDYSKLIVTRKPIL